MGGPATDFENLFNAMSEPAIIVDRSRTAIVGINRAIATRLPDEDLILAGKSLNDVFRLEGSTADERGENVSGILLLRNAPPRFVAHVVSCSWVGQPAELWLLNFGPGESASSSEGALLEYLRESTDQLEAINQIVSAVNASRTIEHVFDLASRQMRTLIGFDRASIAICSADGRTLKVFAISEENSGSLEIGAEAPLQGTVTELALAERRTIVIPELNNETRFNVYADLKRNGFRSAACCPLFSSSRAIGSLNLTCREPNAFNRKHLLALERLAQPLAIAIEKIVLLEDAEHRSRQMEAAAKREELARRIGRQLSGSLDPSLVLQEAVDSIGQTLRANRAHITIFEEGQSHAFVTYEFVSDRSMPHLRSRRLPVEKSNYVSELIDADGELVKSLNDNESDPLLQLYTRMGTRSVAGAPLTIGGRKSGFIELHDADGERRWSEDDRKLLSIVAEEISVALTNAGLYEGIRRHSEELSGLYRISRLFSTLQDTSDIYGKLSRSIAELLGAERCVIATYDRRRKRIRAERPGFNVEPELIKRLRFTLEGNDAATALHVQARPFFSNEPLADDRFDRAMVRQFDVRSLLAIPMRIKGELLGYIYAANKPGGFTRHDLHMLEIFAGQATETIANARLFATVQAHAEREAVINRLLLTMQNMPDAKQAVDMVIERVADVLALDRCVAVLFEAEERPEFRGEWCAPGVTRISNDSEVMDRSPIANWLKLHRQPLISSDVRVHSIAQDHLDLIERANLKSIVVVPIMSKGNVVGAISAQQTRRIRHWAEDDVDLLTAVAAHVGTTLQNAHLINALREGNRLKDEFLATVSHELKTPLTAIRGWVELLAQSPSLAVEQEWAEGINVIRNSALSLTQLISDLLELSRIQRRAIDLNFQPGDVNLAVLDAVQMVRHSAEERHLTLDLELDKEIPTSLFDDRRIQQVIWNLLTNAVKFTPPHGKIIVRSRAVELGNLAGVSSKRRNWIRLEVEDNGEGVPKEFLPFVWERFRQADGSSIRRHNGLGIGLTLVKELVEAHRGFVDVKSEGRGAIFTVMIPVITDGLQGTSPSFDESDLKA